MQGFCYKNPDWCKISQKGAKVTSKFEDLSMHQRMQYLHDLMMRIRESLTRRQLKFLGLEEAPPLELLKHNQFFRTLAFARAPEKSHKIQKIYRIISPRDPVPLPDRCRDKSILMMLVISLFNQYYPQLTSDRIIETAVVGLREFGALSNLEAQKINEAVQFEEDGRLLYFRFQEEAYRCVLNPHNGYGYEMTTLKKS